MKKFRFILGILLMLSITTSCTKVEEVDAKQVAESLIEYIEQGDYDSASDMFCKDTDEVGKTLSELLNEFEEDTGLDLQSKIEIEECTDYISKYSGTYGTIPCVFLDFTTTIDGQNVNIDIDMMKKDENLECFFLNLEYKNELYQYVCQTGLHQVVQTAQKAPNGRKN